ncbi:MAG: hypothetical protein AB1744_06695 [Candidatus Zixiibacteriota bacterium]
MKKEKKPDDRPLTYKLACWYAFIFSAMFVLYGGIKVILSILDRSYADLGKPIIFGLLGLLLITVAFAFKEQKPWSWYGLIGIFGLVILIALLGLSNAYNVAILILTLAALGALIAPQTKEYVFKRH